MEGASATIPLFMWSDKQILAKQNEQILETLTQEDIENSLYSLLGLETKQNFLGSIQGTPAAVVLFVEPQLQTDQVPHFGAAYATAADGGAFSALKSIIETSQSSLVAPYATSGISFSLLDTLLARVASKVSLVLIRDAESPLFQELSRRSDVQTLATKDFTKSDLLYNGKTALIVVCLDKAQSADDIIAHAGFIASISKSVSTATSGNFVGMYTGNAAPSNILWTFPNPNAAFFEQPQLGMWEVQAGNNTGNYTGPRTYLTGTVLEVFMVVIALLVMLFVGVCNICNLQVPETYEAPKPQQKLL